MSTLGNNLLAQYYAQNSLSARSYIQNGLVNMWDGIENDGWGKHDDTIRSWKDLIGNVYSPCHDSTNPVIWGDNCWQSQGTTIDQSFDAVMDSSIVNNAHITIETVSMRKTSNRCTLFGQFGLVGSAGFPLNLEGFENAYRAYWNNRPDIRTGRNTYLNDSIYYFATLTDNNYRIIYQQDGSVVTSDGTELLTSSVFRIGCDYRTTSMNFGGNIYAIRVYNRTLSNNELAYNLSIDKRRFNF